MLKGLSSVSWFVSRNMSRGAFIVFEGCDRCGKTTQTKKLVETLNADGIKAQLMVFPDRSTAIGRLIDDYLTQKCDLEDHAIHLLFAANRWEMVPRMQKALASGTTLIVDRYSFSGVAFSAAKPTLDLDWCRQPEMGLLKPDAVLYMTLSPEEAAKRGSYGDERYEKTSFQKTVAENYQRLREDDWRTIDASGTVEEIHAEIKTVVCNLINDVKGTPPPGSLWCENSEPQHTGHAEVGSGDGKTNGTAQDSTEPPVKKIKSDSVQSVDCDSSHVKA